MMLGFECAAGSVPGRDHVGHGRLLVGKNNQDAWAVYPAAGTLVAVVCDGCSGGRHSEIGAAIGARLVARAVSRHLVAGADIADALEPARQEVLGRLDTLAATLGADRAAVVTDYLLFTIVGVALTARDAAVFALGDGMIATNGDWQRLGPFPANAPPYLGYGLLQEPAPRFELLRVLPTPAVESIVLGSDGVEDLVAAADRAIPGTLEPVGAPEQFWRNDLFFRNPDALRRRLARINSPVFHPTHQPGLLHDDTTLVVLRRRRVS
jgi:hypothetical protein